MLSCHLYLCAHMHLFFLWSGSWEEKVYHLELKKFVAYIRSAMLYMTKHYAIKCQQERKLSIIKMRTLKWISGHIRQDKIRNTIIKEKKIKYLGSSNCKRYGRFHLKLFGQVRRKPINALVWWVEHMEDKHDFTHLWSDKD